MKPYYDQAGIQIFHGDCREIMPALEPGSVGLVLTDPPLGIGWVPRINHRGAAQLWHDNTPFDPAPCLALGSLHIFWGAQYFAAALPPSGCWLTWVKRPLDYDFSNDGRTYATTELAWTDLSCKNAFKAIVWDGGMRAGCADNRLFCHPSQKPLELMTWCLQKAPTGTVLDPFMGSGTTLRAAKDLGRKAIGIEIEERYCAIAARRLAQGVFDWST